MRFIYLYIYIFVTNIYTYVNITAMAKEIKTENSMQQAEETPKERRLRQMLRERYPDEIPQEDNPDLWNTLEDRFADDVSNDLGELSRYKESEMTIKEVMMAYPDFGNILYDVVVAKTPIDIAISKHFSAEDLIRKEGEEGYEDYQASYNEKLEKAKKMSEQQALIDKNEEESIARIDAFAEAKGLSEEQKNELLDKINAGFVDMLHKIVSDNVLEAFYKDMVFDGEVSSAEQAGQVKGRNEAIEQMRGKAAVAQAGDGVPAPSKGGEAIRPEKKENPVFSGLKQRRGI